jgi:bile acid:Na+ symporter, BASS family
MNPTALIQLTLKISIVLSVLALGLRATLQDATYLFRAPGKLARTRLAMYVAMPLFAIAFALAFDLNPAARPPNPTAFGNFFTAPL